MKNIDLAKIILRSGLAFVFFYAAISAFLKPDNWTSFFPDFILSTFPEQLIIYGFTLYHIFLGTWLLSGKWIYYASLVTAATLIGIVIFNLEYMDLIFRDIGLIAASFALAFLSKE